MKHLFYILVSQIFVNIYAQGTYKAAVVEYAAKTTADTYKYRVLENVMEYINYIEIAADKNVDIIVFPETGLTGRSLNESNVDEMSTEVPNPDQSFAPCSSPGNFSKALIDLSCAAQTHKLYVVVNLIERVYDSPTRRNIYHNTVIVLNRSGVVVVRFRKINLFDEAYITPGNITVSFQTEFGVTFGIFICNDILFKHPALDVLLDESVTDIIFPTAWYSELPFLGALSVQHGYAITNRVNLLVSGYDNPTLSNGGSAIFLSNGTVLDVYISGAQSSKMLVAEVPRTSRVSSQDYCQNSVNPPETAGTRAKLGGGMPDISGFKTIKENMVNYTFKSLNLNQNEIIESVCSNQNSCCFINTTITRLNVDMNYVYKLVVFDGGRYLSTESIGTRSCGLVACATNHNQSCGARLDHPPNGVVFEKVFLKGIFKNIKNSQYTPSTINYNLEPVHNYTFCKRSINDTDIEITLSTEKQSNLLTFGIFGRVFDNDNKGTGSFSNASFNIISPYIVLIISIAVFLMQD